MWKEKALGAPGWWFRQNQRVEYATQDGGLTKLVLRVDQVCRMGWIEAVQWRCQRRGSDARENLLRVPARRARAGGDRRVTRLS